MIVNTYTGAQYRGEFVREIPRDVNQPSLTVIRATEYRNDSRGWRSLGETVNVAGVKS